MNKQEYLERLQECLKHKLPREEIEDIMRDYAEYFEEGRRQSQQDSQIAAKLGDPELVAQQLIEESQEQAEEKVHVGAEKKVPWSHAWGYVTDKVKDAKEKFDQWDKGEGAQERPQPEAEQPQKSEKASSRPKQHDEEGVILRFCNLSDEETTVSVSQPEVYTYDLLEKDQLQKEENEIVLGKHEIRTIGWRA